MGVTQAIVEEDEGVLTVDGTVIDTLGECDTLPASPPAPRTLRLGGLDAAGALTRKRAAQILETIACTLIAGQPCSLNCADSDDARLASTLIGLRAARLLGHEGPEPAYGYIFRWQDGLSNFDRWCLENKRSPINGRIFAAWIVDWFWAFGRQACEWVVRYRRLEISRVLPSYKSCVELMLRGRTVIPSASGRPVLAPNHARAGDLVCILFDCPVPIILRRVNDHYVLIGECYVDDFLNGDGFDQLEKHTNEVRFNIR